MAPDADEHVKTLTFPKGMILFSCDSIVNISQPDRKWHSSLRSLKSTLV